MDNDVLSEVTPTRPPQQPGGTQHAQQFERLLGECRELTRERLSQSLSGMLDKAADALWEMHKATQDRDTQKLYQEVKERLLPQRNTLEEGFRRRYLAEFDNRAARARKTKAGSSGYAETSLELGLVGEDDLTETLKVNEMAGRLRAYCEEELAALDQRVGVLLGDANLQTDSNPLSPQAACDAFKQACRDIEPDLRIRMVLVKLFDDHVLDDVRSIYKAVNALLVQHSILPKIRYGVSRSKEGSEGSLAAGVAAALGAGALPPGAATAAPGGGQDVFALLQGMLAANAKAMGPALTGVAPQVNADGAPAGAVQIPGFPPILGMPGQADGAAQALLQGAALLGSLTHIQHGNFSAAGVALPSPATATEAGTTNVLRELKATSVGSGMGQMDVATLDIMAMLFDQIFGDPKIPAGVKWLVGRLQIPMLKVAILDKTFFSTPTHPARQLLDTLGEIGVGLPADFDNSSPLYKTLETIVDKLIDGFDESMEIFDVLRQELQDVVAQENKLVEQETLGTTKRLEQKERLGVAKALARDEIRARLRAGPLPKTVQKFLAQHWMKLLLITYAKRGQDSDAWKSALETMDHLIWSLGSKPTPEERRKLASLLPGLLKRIAAGMQIVGAKEPARKSFLADLMKLHTKVMGGPVARAAPLDESAAGAKVEAQAKVEEAKTAPAPSPEASVATAPVADKRAAPRDAAASAPAANKQAAPRDAVASAPAGDKPAAPRDAAASAPAADKPAASRDAAASALAANKPAAPRDVAASAPAADKPTVQRDDAASAPAAKEEPEFDPASLDFTTVVVKNPFGEGEIQVGEIELPAVPGAPATAVKEGDEHSRLASSLTIGTWLEFRDEKQRHQVKLSYVSPFKTEYLFVNRQGKTVGEYSLYELAAELRNGRAVIMEHVPLFDRAMNGLMGALRA
jgi:Protein of unknown function (DUF1631)